VLFACYLINGSRVIRVSDTPIATIRLALQMLDIRDIVQRLFVEYSLHKIRMRNPVESNENTVYFTICNKFFTLFSCDLRVKE
jgi:hypothetical protein